MAATRSSDVVVVGGAMLDIIYQSMSPTTLATTMYGTSTPCKLARMTLGGVGRNIAEGLARLGVDVTLRTVLGGDVVDGTLKADSNGQFLMDGMVRLGRECPTFAVSAGIVAGSSSATYIALLDGRGDLASAAAVVDVFEKHFTSEVGMEIFNKGNGADVTVDPSTVKWAVIDGNVSQETIDGVCRGVKALNTLNGLSIRIAYDPISKTQSLRCVNSLPLIDLMKPNVYEAITVAIDAVERREGNKGNTTVVVEGVDSTMIATDVSEVTLNLAQNIHAVLRAWEQRHKSSIPCRDSADSNRLHVTELQTFTLESDGTFNGILALATAAAARLAAANAGHATAGGLFSPAAALLWEVFEQLPIPDQELLGLLATVHLIVEEGVGKVLCSLGEGGCWVVVRASDGSTSVAVRRVPCIPIPSGRLVKVTGAGDSYLSGYLYGLLQEEAAEGTPNKVTVSPAAAASGWLLPERAAALAALSSLISDDTISPCIRAVVESDGIAAKL